MTIGRGAIMEDRGGILLQRRADNGMCGIPGGIMENGETVLETVKREVKEKPLSSLTNFHYSVSIQEKKA